MSQHLHRPFSEQMGPLLCQFGASNPSVGHTQPSQLSYDVVDTLSHDPMAIQELQIPAAPLLNQILHQDSSSMNGILDPRPPLALRWRLFRDPGPNPATELFARP